MTDDEQNATTMDSSHRARALVEQLLLSRGDSDPSALAQLLTDHPDLRDNLREEIRKLGQIDETLGAAASTTFAAAPNSRLTPRGIRLQLPGYEIKGRIGAGGQASVFRAVQISTGQTVAIKAMYGGALSSTSARKRFDREVRLLVELNHPQIANVIDRCSTDEGTPVVIMRYVDGQNLDDWLKDRLHDPPEGAGAFSIKEIVFLFVRICRAVEAAHRKGIVHRDLKPSNIRVDARGEPHILDFGLAHEILFEPSDPDHTKTGQFVGSLPWASPEQLGAVPGPVSAASDVFSLGLLLFETLAGELPLDTSGSLKELIRSLESVGKTAPSKIRAMRTRRGKGRPTEPISRLLDAITLKAIALDPHDRYASAGQFADDLQAFLSGQPTLARRRSLRRKANPAGILFATLACCLAVSAIGIAWHRAAALPAPAACQGQVWTDLDADGFRQSAEPGIAGARVFLDLNGNGQLDNQTRSTTAEPFAVTNGKGHYQLEWNRATLRGRGEQGSQPVRLRCQTNTQVAPTFPLAPPLPARDIFVLVNSRTLRRVSRGEGVLPDFQRGEELSIDLAGSLPDTLLFIAEDDTCDVELSVMDDRQLLVAWVRDNRYLARLTLLDHHVRVDFLGNLPPERQIIDFGDIDGDGRCDLLVRSTTGVPDDEDDWYVQTCRGTIDGKFNLQAPLQRVAQRRRNVSMWLEDVNENGVLDLLINEVQWGGYFTFELKVAYGQGDGSFGFDQATVLLRGPTDHGLSMRHPIDLDGDGDRDLLLVADDDTQDEGQSYVAINKGLGNYELRTFIDFVPTNEAGGQDLSVIYHVVPLDMDQDGHLDLLVLDHWPVAGPARMYRSIDRALQAGDGAEAWPFEWIDLATPWNRIAWPSDLAHSPGGPGLHVLPPKAMGDVPRDFGFPGLL